MTVDVEPLPRHIDLFPRELVITRAAHLPADASHFDKPSILESHSANDFRTNLHDFSLQCDQYHHLAFLAFQFDTDLHLFAVGLQDVDDGLLALALQEQQQFLSHHILAVGQQ